MKLLMALASAALLTAACAASATVTGAGAGAGKSANTVQVASGANTGIDVQGNDVNRVNPLIGKAGKRPVPPAQPQVIAPAPAQPFDRCTGGFGTTQPGYGPQSGSSPKHPPLPMCAPQ